MKIVRKARLQELETKIMKDEIAIMTKFDHVNVVKHLESYEDKQFMFIVMEALTDSCEL